MESINSERRNLLENEVNNRRTSNSHLISDENLENEVFASISSCSRCCSKTKSCLSYVTVEVPLCLYLFVWSFQGIIRTNIVLDKTCRNYFNFTDELCANLSNHTDEQTAVQLYVTQFNLYTSLIENIPGVFFVLFLGAWSDKYGRKIPLTLPHIGNLISDLVMLVNILVWNIPVQYILLASIPKALTGGFACAVMVSYSYISDITKREDRTIRIAFLDLFFAVGPTCGLVLCSFIIGPSGYVDTYVLSTSVFLVCILYIVIRIAETRGANAVIMSDVQQMQCQSLNHEGKLISIFDGQNLKETFKITFKKRENYGRVKIFLLMTAMCCLVFVFSSLSLDYLYTMKKFSWTYFQYINFCVTTFLIIGVGLGLLLPIISFICHSSDAFLAICGCLSLIALKLTEAFASVGYQMYIGAVVGLFGGFPLVTCRSMISKLVSSHETGKIFSVLASYESLIPLIAAPVFTLTYDTTIDTFIGSYLLVGAMVYGIALVLFMIVGVLIRRYGNGVNEGLSLGNN